MYSLIPKRNYVKPSNNDFYNVGNLMESLFDDSFWRVPSFNQTDFKLDIKDTDEAYLIEAELPGVNKEDVALEYKDERLYINVKHEDAKEEENDHFIHKERAVSAMSRTILLRDIDGQNIEAELKDGILSIKANKVAELDSTINIKIR